MIIYNKMKNFKQCIKPIKNINILFSTVSFPKSIKLVKTFVPNLFWPTYSLRIEKVQDILCAKRNDLTQANTGVEGKLID